MGSREVAGGCPPSGALGVLGYVLYSFLNLTVALAGLAVVLVGAHVLLDRWMRGRGAQIFDSL